MIIFPRPETEDDRTLVKKKSLFKIVLCELHVSPEWSGGLRGLKKFKKIFLIEMLTFLVRYYMIGEINNIRALKPCA